MTGSLRVALACWHLAWLSQLERRISFAVQMLMMAINDAIWVVFWLLVFAHKDSIRGWERDEVLVLFSIVTFTYGMGIGLFYGVRRLGQRIQQRDLDPWLAQPRPVLVRVLFGKVHPPLLGDLAFGPVLFVVATGGAPLDAWGRYLLVSVIAASIVVAFILAWESLAFWSEAGGEVAGVAFTAISVLSTYPAAIYSGVVKVVVFTVVPAAFIGSVPAGVVLDPSVEQLALLALAALLFWCAALAIFHAGLRRYLRAAA